MSQKITCPHCEKEFPMEDGLSSHLKELETKARERIEKEKDQNSNKESDSKDEVNWKDLIKDDDK